LTDTALLSGKIVASIALLQSMAALLPNRESILKFVSRGLCDVAGVEKIEYRLDGVFEAASLKNHNSAVFPIKRGGKVFAELLIHLYDYQKFEPNIPFISNFANMLGVIFEVEIQRKQNQALIAELEERVAHRTRELQTSKQKYQEIIENTNVLITTVDGRGNFLFVNTEANRIFGMSAENLLGVSAFDFIYPEDVEPTANWFNRCVSFHVDKDMFENRLVNKVTNEVFHLLWTCNFYYDNQGNISAIHSIGLDVTARKQAEEAVVHEKERLSVTLRCIGDGVITTDIKGCVVLMNKVAEDLTGWKQQDALGKILEDVFPIINETTRKKQDNPVERVLATGGIIELANHTLLVSRDGKERSIADSAAPIKDKENKTIGVVLVFRDMTEKQRFLEITQNSQKLEALGVLAGGIAHDFNNLLGGIFGYIDLAQESAKDTQAGAYLIRALNAIERARALTGQLLTFAKGGSPVQKIERLFPFLEETVKFALSGTKVLCNFHVSPELWASNFDKNQISQVIDNLVINAQQAMPRGGTIELSAYNTTLDEKEHPSLAKGDYVKIILTDQGMGIPKELIPKIFDPFFTTKTNGHGLGLATCYSIINKHGGCIDVDSILGKGTTFSVYLPAVKENPALSRSIQEKNHTGNGVFLVMDDEEVVREMMGVMLESLGYTVIKKEKGKDALDYFFLATEANQSFAGMIFDLTVPGGIGGKEAIGQIRKVNNEVPVFVVSGYADDTIMKSPTSYGFTASLCKPFRKSELVEMLDKHLILNK